MAKVKAAPNTARLITINDTDGKSYDIIPGGEGEVVIPNRLAKGPFVQGLVKSGDLIVTEVGDDEPETGDDAIVEELRAQAEELGVKVDKRWKAERIQQEIDKAKEDK